MALVFPFALLPSNTERGAELLLGHGRRLGATTDGSKFPFSGWSQGRIEPPNREGEAGSHSRQKFGVCNHLYS